MIQYNRVDSFKQPGEISLEYLVSGHHGAVHILQNIADRGAEEMTLSGDILHPCVQTALASTDLRGEINPNLAILVLKPYELFYLSRRLGGNRIEVGLTVMSGAGVAIPDLRGIPRYMPHNIIGERIAIINPEQKIVIADPHTSDLIPEYQKVWKYIPVEMRPLITPNFEIGRQEFPIQFTNQTHADIANLYQGGAIDRLIISRLDPLSLIPEDSDYSNIDNWRIAVVQLLALLATVKDDGVFHLTVGAGNNPPEYINRMTIMLLFNNLIINSKKNTPHHFEVLNRNRFLTWGVPKNALDIAELQLNAYHAVSQAGSLAMLGVRPNKVLLESMRNLLSSKDYLSHFFSIIDQYRFQVEHHLKKEFELETVLREAAGVPLTPPPIQT